MPRIPALSPKKIMQKLKKLGFVQDHISGSHIVMYHPQTQRRAVIPYHLKDIPKGTLSALLREANISRQEFLSS